MPILYRCIFIGIAISIIASIIDIEDIIRIVLIGVSIGLVLAVIYYTARFAMKNTKIFIKYAIYVVVAIVAIVVIYNILDYNDLPSYAVAKIFSKLILFVIVFGAIYFVNKIGDKKEDKYSAKQESSNRYSNDDKTTQNNYHQNNTNYTKTDEIPSWLKQYYDLLEIPTNASKEQIKQAYKNLAKKYHPDLNKSAESQERFIEIQTAYQTIMKNFNA
ncbi:DnaJ domain-containing protein [Helicobacter sp. T3_23-1059]